MLGWCCLGPYRRVGGSASGDWTVFVFLVEFGRLANLVGKSRLRLDEPLMGARELFGSGVNAVGLPTWR